MWGVRAPASDKFFCGQSSERQGKEEEAEVFGIVNQNPSDSRQTGGWAEQLRVTNWPIKSGASQPFIWLMSSKIGHFPCFNLNFIFRNQKIDKNWPIFPSDNITLWNGRLK